MARVGWAMSYQRLRSIAIQVRRDMENRRHELNRDSTFGYKILWHLGGLCTYASVEISLRATKSGLRGVRVVDSGDGGHSFVRWGHWLVDVTATQFNNRRPRVCIVNLSKRRHPLPEYWQEATP